MKITTSTTGRAGIFFEALSVRKSTYPNVHKHNNQLRLIGPRRWASQTNATRSQAVIDVPRGIQPSATTLDGTKVARRPLRQVSTGHLLRSLLLGRTFASPRLLSVSLKFMKWMISSKSFLVNPDKNIVLGKLVRLFVYDHFASGTTAKEVRQTITSLKEAGFSGVNLGISKEIVVDDPKDAKSVEESKRADRRYISEWLQANLETLNLIDSGDSINIKFTGAGPAIGNALLNGEKPPSELVKALEELCQQAKSQGKRIWVDAEQQVFQKTIDQWAIELMRRHNTGSEAVVYNTIQSYLKASRENFLRHLNLAKSEGWVLGIKLVRGAYISSDRREAIWDTKPETDANYNSIVRDILSKSFAPFTKKTFPRVDLFVAGHNKESIRRATSLVCDLVAQGEDMRPVRYGQLQGMADEVSYDLVQLSKTANDCTGLSEEEARTKKLTAPRPVKVLTWGPVGECMHFMMRRAVENATAMDRLHDGLIEVRKELKRRLTPWSRA